MKSSSRRCLGYGRPPLWVYSRSLALVELLLGFGLLTLSGCSLKDAARGDDGLRIEKFVQCTRIDLCERQAKKLCKSQPYQVVEEVRDQKRVIQLITCQQDEAAAEVE